jgi:hypothetical protein
MRPDSVLKLLAFVLPPGLDSVAAAIGAIRATTVPGPPRGWP